jgi:hypothetical protein
VFARGIFVALAPAPRVITRAKESTMHRKLVSLLPFVTSGALAIASIGCSGESAGVPGSSGSSDPFASNGSSGSSGSSGGRSSFTPPSDGEALYGAPFGSATPDSIFGLWGGSLNEGGTLFDMRMKIGASAITFANRCTVSNGKRSGVVSVTAAARVSQESVVVLETKQDQKDDGIVRCSVSLTPRQLERCGADQHEGFERECFRLDGTKLEIFGETSFEKFSFAKLSD